jgi:hypothetical protein
MDQNVILRRDPQRWRKLPIAVQMDLVEARIRVSKIREQIAATSLVTSMPPVEIHDVAWTSTDLQLIVHGREKPIVLGGQTYYAALLSGPTAIHASDVELQGVLLHEFSHCFNSLRRVYRHVKSGTTEQFTCGKPLDDSDEAWNDWDRSLLERPEDWFSSENCSVFPYHHDPLTQACTNAVFQNWVVKGLPVDFSHRNPFDIQDQPQNYGEDVYDRIRELEGDL